MVRAWHRCHARTCTLGDDMVGEREVLSVLDEAGIVYRLHRHEALLTCEQALAAGIPHEEGQVATKNLFLRDDKKREYFLVTTTAETRVDLGALKERLGSRRLSFASERDLASLLGLTRGAVTPFGLLNDVDRRVTFVLDRCLAGTVLDAHPNVNTATVQLEADDLLDLLAARGTEIRLLDL